MAAARIQTFREFWPFYVAEHRHPLNRTLHFVGTTLVIAWFVAGVALRHPALWFAMPLSGYSFAWVGHFLVEKNRPATFTYPLFSLAADFVMYGKMWAGKMADEVRALPN